MDITTNLHHNVYHVKLKGRFVFSSLREFRPILEKLNENNVYTILFDMEDVDFIDSSGLGMLLLASDEARKHQKLIKLIKLKGQVKKMLDLSCLSTIIKID